MKPLRRKTLIIAAISMAQFTQICSAIETTFEIQISQGNDVVGSGQVTTTEISPGTYLATSGFIHLAAGGPFSPLASSASLVPTAGQGLWVGGGPGDYEYGSFGGTDLGFDDLILNTGPGTYSLTDWGLLFHDATGGVHGDGLDFNPFLNPPNVVLYNGQVYDPYAAIVPVNIAINLVPDGGATLALLGIGTIALLWGHRMSRAKPKKCSLDN